MVPVQRIDLLKRLLGQLKVLKVLGDARRRHRLGQHDGAALNGPLDEHLRGGFAEGFRDGDDGGVVDRLGEVVDVVARGGVGGDEDVSLLGPFEEVGLLEEGVGLNLVDGWLDHGAETHERLCEW